MSKKGKKDESIRYSKNTPRSFEIRLAAKMKLWVDGLDLKSAEEVPGIDDKVFEASPDLIIFPCSLNPYERKILHKVAVELSLHHASFGEGAERFVCFSKTPHFTDIEKNLQPSEAKKNPWYDNSVPKVNRFPSCLELNGHELHKLHCFIHNQESSSFSYTILYHYLEDLTFYPPSTHIAPILIDSEELLVSLTDYLSSLSLIAFDCEMHSYRSYYGLTCIIQVSDGQNNYIIDCLKLWDKINKYLNPIFTSPTIVKVGHGCNGGDIPALFRDFCIVIVNFFDTQIAALALGLSGHNTNNKSIAGNTSEIPDTIEDDLEVEDLSILERQEVSTTSLTDMQPKDQVEQQRDLEESQDTSNTSNSSGIGLAALLTHFKCPQSEEITELKRTVTTSDWRSRPLPAEMLQYAQLDVHYLIPLFHIIVQALLRAGGAPCDGLLKAAPPPPLQLSSSAISTLSHNLLDDDGEEEPTGETTATGRGGQEEEVYDDEEELLNPHEFEDISGEDDESLWQGWGEVTVTSGAGSDSVGGVLTEVGAESAIGPSQDLPSISVIESPLVSASASLSESWVVTSPVDRPPSSVQTTGRKAGGHIRSFSDEGDSVIVTGTCQTITGSSNGSSNESLEIVSDTQSQSKRTETGTAVEIPEIGIWTEIYLPHDLDLALKRDVSILLSDATLDRIRVPTSVALDTNGYNTFARVVNKSLQICTKIWTPPSVCDDVTKEGRAKVARVLRAFRKKGLLRAKSGGKRWSELNTVALKLLVIWRDERAKADDESASYVCPSEILVEYAKAMPTTLRGLRLVSHILPAYLMEDMPVSDGGPESEATVGKRVQSLIDTIERAAEVLAEVRSERHVCGANATAAGLGDDIDEGGPVAATKEAKANLEPTAAVATDFTANAALEVANAQSSARNVGLSPLSVTAMVVGGLIVSSALLFTRSRNR